MKLTVKQLRETIREAVNDELMKDVIVNTGKEEKELDFPRGDMSWDFADDDWDTLVSKELQKQGLMLADEDDMNAHAKRVKVGDDEYEVYVVPMPARRVREAKNAGFDDMNMGDKFLKKNAKSKKSLEQVEPESVLPQAEIDRLARTDPKSSDSGTSGISRSLTTTRAA
jgi:hypothetical protein